MDKDHLNESLIELRDELRSVTAVDDSSRETLRRLDDDIHRILNNEGGVPAEHHASLRESLQDSIQVFEASHPTVTILVERLIKALSDMGI
ncbi:MAG: DUF4404 family protein [Acidobacteriota bacterium]|nr:DUF4404 family protein [Acidobacteriota bacterium]